MRRPVYAKNAGSSSTITISSRRSVSSRAIPLSCGITRAERERAEHGVDADKFGRRGRNQQRDEYRRHHALRQPPAISVQQRQANHRGPHRPPASGRCIPAPSRSSSPRPRLRPRHADHECQHAPRGHVVHRGAGQRNRAHPGFMNSAIGQYSRQHRKCRHRHRDAKEQREAGERHVARRQTSDRE